MKVTDEGRRIKQIFLAEAQDGFEELNRLFTQLEKNHSDREVTEAILNYPYPKGNAAMGLRR